MPLTAAQIVTLANQAAKTPGFTSQAGQKLNDILQELCQTYDLAAARKLFTFNFNIGPNGTNIGSGPYSLPADYLRTQNGKQFYVYNGQPYFMTRVELWEYDALVQQPGFQDFPRNYTVDTAPAIPQEFVWPPPSISVPVSIRYFSQMPDIATPETSAVVPWFPYTNYLITRLTGEMMAVADDTRAADFLTSNEQQNPQGAGVLLRRYLNMKDDPEGRAKTVELDGRRFGNGGRWNRLPNTKSIGWALAALWLGLSLFGGAHAQTSQATITAAIASAFPDNTSGQITPATTRSFLTTLNGAIFQAQGASGLIFPTTSALSIVQNPYTPPVAFPGTQPFQIQETVTGTCTTTATNCFYNFLSIPSDNAVVGSGSSGTFVTGTGFFENHLFGGAAMTGNRQGALFRLQQTATTGNTAATATYAAIVASTSALANDNGVDAGVVNSRGQIESVNIIASLGASATNFRSVQGGEVDTNLAAGSSTYQKVGWQITQLSTDAVQGATYDTAVAIANQAGAVGWKTGILFGGVQGVWPFATTAKAITCDLSCGTLASVIDFGNATITANALKFPGFAVDGVGRTALGTNGGTGAQLTLNGATSGASTITAAATGGGATISSGSSTSIAPLTLSDTVAGADVTGLVSNASAANNSIARFRVVTGVASTSTLFQVTNAGGAPQASINWGSGVTAGFLLTNNGTQIAGFNNGVQVGTPTGGDKGAGTLNIQSTIWTNGTQSIATRTCTVNQALTLIFTNGLLTGGTCVS